MSEVREQFADMVFPIAGIHLASEFATPPPNTTRQAQNVRANDFLQRIRGGSRNGLEKYIPAMVAGPNRIQDLNIVVYTDPLALLTAIDAFADFPDPSTNNNAAGYGDRNPDPDGQGPRYVRTGGSGISQNRHVRTPHHPLLIITPNNQTKVFGTTFNFNGNEFTHSTLFPGDDVVLVQLNSAGAGSGAAIGSYAITSANAIGTGLSRYSIQYHQGTMHVQPGGSWGTFNTGLGGTVFSLTGSPSSGFLTASVGASVGDSILVCVTISAALVTYPTAVLDDLGNGYANLGSVITVPGHITKSQWGVYTGSSGTPTIEIQVPAGSGSVNVYAELWSGGDGVTFPPAMDTPCS